jgi:glycosyltransferase involved in cell wall biosynthesis
VKILWVKPGKLLPLDSGGKLRTYNILRHLCESHSVTFLSYYAGTQDKKYEEDILQHLPGTVPVANAIHEVGTLRRSIDFACDLATRVPHSVSRFTSPRVQEILAEWIAERRFDIAICDFLASAGNFPRELGTPTALFQHNVETLLWKRRAHFGKRLAARMIANVEYAKMARYEPVQVRRFHRVLAVSEQDRQAMSAMVDASCIGVIPTGVDLCLYKFDPESRPDGALVMFTGSMDWEPNIDGIEYFCRHIWPHVVRAIPDARFRIVGRNPDLRVKKLACDSIEVTGSVPSVVEHLRKAAVLVVPLRMGGGTRIKIYEGMALGKATVSTSIGAEGLDVQHGRNILLADDPAQFAKHVVGLLRDEKRRRSYEVAAAESMRQSDWSMVSRIFVKEIEKVTEAFSMAKGAYRGSRLDFLNFRRPSVAGRRSS